MMVFSGPLGKVGKKEIKKKGGKNERKKQGEREKPLERERIAGKRENE